MAGLQGLEDKYSGGGLHVMGFFSNDFGMQGGTGDQIDACTEKYAVTFEQFAIDHVNTAPVQPVWTWLLSQPNPGPASGIAPTWNFHKYLISKTGELVGHWPSETYPGDDPNDPNDSWDTNPVSAAIQVELAK